MRYFASACIGVAVPGRPAWINGHPYGNYDRPRGCVAITEDGRTRFYRVSRTERSAFKSWAVSVYSGMNCARLVGAWPDYEVKQP